MYIQLNHYPDYLRSVILKHYKLIKTSYNRDGIKSKGDKIGMPCTHSTVI